MADGDLQSLGQTLREAREARALALDEVETQTRIRVKFLQALESGDLSVLPSVTHAKGFLRNYAQFLHLDANLLVSQFGELTGSGTTPVTRVTVAPLPPAPPPMRAVHPPYVDYSVGDGEDPDQPIMLPTVYPPQPTESIRGATYISPRDRVGPAGPRGAPIPARQHPPSEAAPDPHRARTLPGRVLQSNLMVGAVLLVGSVAIVWWATTQLSAVSIEGIVPTPEQSQFLQEFAGSATVPASQTFEPTSTAAPQTGPQILDRVLLNISVEQHTWTRIIVDGEVAFEGLAEPGSVLQYEGQETILVLAGNGAGLDITYNGQEIGPMGERGEIVERTFTSGGEIIAPTATPTLTTTPTSVPSPTPRTSPSTGEDD